MGKPGKPGKPGMQGESPWRPEGIRAMRRRLGISQQAFARLLGVRQQTVSDWETGLHAPQGASRRLLDLIAGDPAPSYGGAAAGYLLSRAAERRAPYGGDAAGEARQGADSSGEDAAAEATAQAKTQAENATEQGEAGA